MSHQIDASRFTRATGNLKKAAIFLGLIGVTMLYLGWIRYPMGGETIVQEMVWVIRIASIMILYVSLKCFLIERYLKSDNG